jgi:hypothetical protein
METPLQQIENQYESPRSSSSKRTAQVLRQ